MERIKGLLAVMACTGVALAAVTANAAEPNVTVIKAGPALDGLKVVKDKVTGKIRPATSEELEEMAQSAAASRFAGSVPVLNRPQTTMVSRPDGSATIRRSVDDLDAVVISRGADGKTVLRHGGKEVTAAPQTNNLPKE